MSTEQELEDWRRGQIFAERLCAAVLAVEGFTDIDPQAPLGGADDKKDILARRDGLRWLAAVFFPPTHKTFASVRSKFEADFEGVARNNADAFAFLVNQRLTLGQRDDLIGSAPFRVEIYHLERLRSILDTPIGYGIRLEYLGIKMSAEEQASFVLELQRGLNERLRTSEVELAKVVHKADELLERTTVMSSPRAQPSSSVVAGRPALNLDGSPMSALTVEMLIFVHRLVAPDSLYPGLLSEAFRPVGVRIGQLSEFSFVPPSPDEVPSRVAEYIEWWRAIYPRLRNGEPDVIIDALAELHHRFLTIHPFLDGNGRVATALLDQAARELLGQSLGPALTADPREYFATLRAADAGDPSHLRKLIANSLR